MSDTLWASGALAINPGKLLTQPQLNDSIEVGAAPIGSIAMWVKSFTGVPSITQGWLECDGSVISDAESPLNGETLPDMNGNNQFLRGSTTSGTTGGSATHTHSVVGGALRDLFGGSTSYQAASTNNEPPYYQCVFIMRIK